MNSKSSNIGVVAVTRLLTFKLLKPNDIYIYIYVIPQL